MKIPIRKLLSAAICISCGTAIADDWPQWLGPERDSIWRETDIVDRFPHDGLKVRWRVPVHLGYTGPSDVSPHPY